MTGEAVVLLVLVLLVLVVLVLVLVSHGLGVCRGVTIGRDLEADRWRAAAACDEPVESAGVTYAVWRERPDDPDEPDTVDYDPR